MRIGIIGSRLYESRKKIKDTVFGLKNKFGEDLLIVSGGCQHGADKYAKKYALELGCQYKEFNPAHTPPNLYSAMNEGYYNKTYQPKNFFHRNGLLVKYVDCLIAFIPEHDSAKGTWNTIRAAKKLGKKIVIIG